MPAPAREGQVRPSCAEVVRPRMPWVVIAAAQRGAILPLVLEPVRSPS